MMKRIGYRPAFAAAVEASASTGGQIMPPIMGAAAFIMSEFIGMPYINIALAAVIPALMWYGCGGLFYHNHQCCRKTPPCYVLHIAAEAGLANRCTRYRHFIDRIYPAIV
jgi:TRAP-type uncharacterized transport system fused permease subunit